MDRELKKQIKRIEKQENKILKRKENKLIKSKVDPVMNKIKGKIPDKLLDTLEAAFIKGFQLVFEKGYVYIEKTYNKNKLQLEYDLKNEAVDRKITRKHIKGLDKGSTNSKRLNSLISIVEGSVLGVMGIGLPDIPLFIAMIIKSVSEVAISYGYNYETREEKAYILLLISGALSKGDKQFAINEEIDELGKKIDQLIVTEINVEKQMNVAAGVLSEAILTAKFIQGIPLIGVVGGIVNYNIIKKIGRYASLKYKKRYLLGKVR
ncbi:MAG: EcsC family protein [Vulcanibacillus sp.]